MDRRDIFVSERASIKALSTWLNGRFNPVGITCLKGKEQTNFPAGKRAWGFSGLSASVLTAALARIQECGTLEMFVRMQSDMLETVYGRQLRDAYDSSMNGSNATD